MMKRREEARLIGSWVRACVVGIQMVGGSGTQNSPFRPDFRARVRARVLGTSIFFRAPREAVLGTSKKNRSALRAEAKRGIS